MKVLVIGGGGREHALAWSLAHSPRVTDVWCAPGNGGIARDVAVADFDVDAAAGIDAAIDFATEHGIDLTVVGPEASLVAGIVDRFSEAGLKIFGPRRAAAALEGSKSFSKEFFARHGIPTAGFRVFDNARAAHEHLERRECPVVVKADGLAAGKGVFVVRDRAEASAAVEAVLVERRFGAAGDRVVIEDCLRGTELTVIVLTDGETIVPLETAQDYKRACDGDQGPNTGGMGSYSPRFPVDSPVVERVITEVIRPTLRGLAAEGIEYRGALYAGLMLTDDGPSVLEYNVRFGDPETQAILLRLRSDLADLLEACVDGTLRDQRPQWDPRPSICVVAASEGYPGAYDRGRAITGLVEADSRPYTKVFCAGVARENDRLVTAGGRVLGVTALGDSLADARRGAYAALESIAFEGMQHRRDIGIPYGDGAQDAP